jgi:hypothetical protein
MPGKRIKWSALGLGGVTRAKNQSKKEYMKLVNASRTAKTKYIRKQCHDRCNKLSYKPRKYNADKARKRRTRRKAATNIQTAFRGFAARLKARRGAAPPMSLRDAPALSAV